MCSTHRLDLLRSIFADVCSHAHVTLVQMDGEDDHVHLLVQYPPKALAASAAPRHPQVRYWKAVLWSPSYLASSGGGAPINIVRQYIEQQ